MSAGVPPYVVFHDSTLRGIAEARPRDLDELGRIEGVGETKLARYGEAMLAVVVAEEERTDGAPA
jgi:ATP-dependent DNA helicase RecQ